MKATSDRKMKVVFLTTRFATGGAPMNALLMARGFAMRGHDAEAWFLMRSGELESAETLTRIFLPHEPRGVSDWMRMLRNFRLHLRSFAPDVIIGFQPLANIVAGVSSLRGRHRCVATQRNPAQSQTKVLKYIEEIVGSTFLYTSNIAVSHSVADSFRQYPKAYRKKLCVIHNGTPPLPSINASKFDCRERFDLPNDCFLIGSIGRLHYQKYPEFLLRVLVEVPGAHLAFAGEGPEEGALRTLCSELGVEKRVRMLGNLSGEDVSRFYRAIDVFVLPSRFEGFGRTLVEAFSQGVPALASDLPVLREVGGAAARLLPLEVNAWVVALKELIESEEARGMMVERGLVRAREFSLEAMVDGYIDQAQMCPEK